MYRTESDDTYILRRMVIYLVVAIKWFLYETFDMLTIQAVHGVYICSRPFRILAHAEFFGIFHLFTLLLEEFDYTARVQHALVAVERK